MSSSPPTTPASPKSPPKGVRGVVRKLKRRISHISIPGRRTKGASLVNPDHDHDHDPPSPSPPEPLLIHTAPSRPISIPVSPRSRASSDSMASTGSVDGYSAQHSVPESSHSSRELTEEETSPLHDTASVVQFSDPLSVPSSYASALDDGDRTPLARVPPASEGSDVLSSPLSSTPAEAEPYNAPADGRQATLDSQFNGSSERVPDAASSPAEPEVPDPFLIDDPEGSPSEGEDDSLPEERPPGLSFEDQKESVADEIALAQSTLSPPPSASASLPSPNINKAVPPPPHSPSDDEDEEDSPDLYLPGLIIPTMFLPIPNTDPLTTLLTKYVPPEKRPVRDVTGEWHRSDFDTLVMTNSWRALARMARDRIVEADPEDLKVILELWYMRLSSLARLRLFNQTSAECSNLFTVLNAVEPPAARQWLFERVLPFDLEVLHAKLKYWAGDHMGYLDALSALLRRCKLKTRQVATKDPVGATLWRERGARLCLILASQLIEMKDFTAAARLLEPLCRQPGGITSPHLQSAVGRIYVQSGYLAMAAKHFAVVVEDPNATPSLKSMNAAMFTAAQGNWEKASQELRALLAAEPENFAAVNNLTVSLLNQGKIKEGILVLEEAITASPAATVVAEPLLFNVSTMYELRSAAGVDKKRSLLVEVAKWAGDGLRTTCLKMPTT